MDDQFQHLMPNNRERFLHILRKFESLFDGTLSTWKPPRVDLDLNDDATPVCSRPYPVTRVHGAMFRKEVERLVKLGVLKEANDLEWRSSSLINLNQKRIVRDS